MANNFKLVTNANVGIDDTNVYTCPSGATATVIGLTVANIYTAVVQINVKLDNSDGDQVHLVKNIPVPVGSSVVPVGGDQKVVLEANDSIIVSSDSDNSADVALSLLEIT